MPYLPIQSLDMRNLTPGEMAMLGEQISNELVKRVTVPVNSTTSPEMRAAIATDAWMHAGQYGLGWVYIPILLIFFTIVFRIYNYWGDKIRTALYKEEVINSALSASPYYDNYEMYSAMTDGSQRHFFPSQGPLVQGRTQTQPTISSLAPVNYTIAFIRCVFYRPIPALKIWRWKLGFPSPGVVAIIIAGVAYSLCHCFIPAPWFYASMQYGSPPLAIRAGMMSVAMIPWIVALASKFNLIAILTGIEPQRLMVLHRWGAYICTGLAIIHAVPFWYQSIQDPAGFDIFKHYFHQQWYIFTTGTAALGPLLFLVLHSLPILRAKAYEVFVVLHIPVSWGFVALMFWHCHNYLTSWAYLNATLALLGVSFLGRLFYVNWSNPRRASFFIGEESAVTILAENAVKVTIPTQSRWRPGQYVYLRMPGVSILDSHPFTIASLCSDDFPSAYGDQYRDMTLVFRPFQGFTRKVLDTASQKGPFKTYRAFIEGPYGGMQRQMSSFDQVIFFAGGSGITAIASQLLDLIKRMRDGKATTKVVHVVWAMKRPEIMEWFKQELRICREYAPFGSIHCNFYITSAKRFSTFPAGNATHKRLSSRLTGKIDEAMQDVATKRDSKLGKFDLDCQAGTDDDENITALPSTYQAAPKFTSIPVPYFPPPPPSRFPQGSDEKPDDKKANKRKPRPSAITTNIDTISTLTSEKRLSRLNPPQPVSGPATTGHATSETTTHSQTFDFGFGFPSEPSPFQKSLMRFAFLPTTTIQPHMAHPRTGGDASHTLSPPAPTLKPAGKQFEDFDFFSSPASESDRNHFSPVNTAQTLSPNTPRASHFSPISPITSATFLQEPPSLFRPRDGWRTEYGRPDISYMLRSLSKDFGKRTCVFVCGPPEMRHEVSRTVAELQSTVWKYGRDELFLHAENYAI